jgi:hypothetical protein
MHNLACPLFDVESDDKAEQQLLADKLQRQQQLLDRTEVFVISNQLDVDKPRSLRALHDALRPCW